MDLPPPPAAIVVDAPRPQDARPQAPAGADQAKLPQTDITVEVVGEFPIAAKLNDVTRLLGLRRRSTGTFSRGYPPTILELITLVERRPAKPRGRHWDSIQALTIRYHPEPRHVIVEYCIDHCDFDPKTGAFDARRKMATYRAAEDVVEKRLDKKLRELQKYAER